MSDGSEVKGHSASARVSDGAVHVSSPVTPTWSQTIPLSSPLQGMELVAPDRLVVRMAADEWDAALDGPTVPVHRTDHDGPVSVTVVECVQPARIFGKSPNGRFLAYKTTKAGTVALLDLDAAPAGEGPVPLTKLDLQRPCTYASRTYVADDGRKVLVTTLDPEYVGKESSRGTRIFQLVDAEANTVLGTIQSAYENYYDFSWSPDGQWIACVEEDLPMPGWDVPVGSTPRNNVRLYDGRSALELWSVGAAERGGLGWTEDGHVRCGASVFDARTGGIVER